MAAKKWLEMLLEVIVGGPVMVGYGGRSQRRWKAGNRLPEDARRMAMISGGVDVG